MNNLFKFEGILEVGIGILALGKGGQECGTFDDLKVVKAKLMAGCRTEIAIRGVVRAGQYGFKALFGRDAGILIKRNSFMCF